MFDGVTASGTAEEGTPEDGGAGANPQDASPEAAEGDEDGGADEGEDPKPAPKHGWNEDEPQADATPEAGPQGRASKTAAAQASSCAVPGLSVSCLTEKRAGRRSDTVGHQRLAFNWGRPCLAYCP